jgi:YVTN family beta-propeller protein
MKPKVMLTVLILFMVAIALPAVNTVYASLGNAAITVGPGPAGLDYDSGKNEVFVACSSYAGNAVSVISDTTDKVVATIPVGASPRAVVYDSGVGELFVSNDGEKTVSVISDISDFVVATVLVQQNPFGMAYDAGKGEIFAANYSPFANSVSVISDTNNTVAATIPVGNSPSWLAYDSAMNEIFVCNTRSTRFQLFRTATTRLLQPYL